MITTLSIIVILIVVGCMIMISFLIGVLCAMPENNPESQIEYLKERIRILEGREHVRVLAEHEFLMQQAQKDPAPASIPAQGKKTPPEKKLVQTTWGGNDGSK